MKSVLKVDHLTQVKAKKMSLLLIIILLVLVLLSYRLSFLQLELERLTRELPQAMLVIPVHAVFLQAKRRYPGHPAGLPSPEVHLMEVLSRIQIKVLSLWHRPWRRPLPHRHPLLLPAPPERLKGPVRQKAKEKELVQEQGQVRDVVRNVVRCPKHRTHRVQAMGCRRHHRRHRLGLRLV